MGKPLDFDWFQMNHYCTNCGASWEAEVAFHGPTMRAVYRHDGSWACAKCPAQDEHIDIDLPGLIATTTNADFAEFVIRTLESRCFSKMAIRVISALIALLTPRKRTSRKDADARSDSKG